MSISNYVSIQITRETQGISKATFNVPLILAEVSEVFERTTLYSSISAVGDDFETDSNVYLMAQKLFSQSPHPRNIKVGRKYANVDAKQEFIPDAIPTAGNFKITLGTETTANIAYNANAAAIKSALEALTAVTTVTVTGDLTALTGFTVEFTGADQYKHWATMTVDASGLTTCTAVDVTVLQYGSAAESFATCLDAIVDYDNEWYLLLAETKTEGDLEDIAAWTEAVRKVYAAKSEDVDIAAAGSSDIASILKAAGYNRTFIAFSEQADHQLDCGWAGVMLPKDPGSATWAYKYVAGVTADSFTDSERSIILGKNANIYIPMGGVNRTEQGKMAGGEWIDVMIGIDWMQARMEELIMQAIVTADKIPYTDAGVAIITGIVGAVLYEAFKKGLINSDYAVDAPKVADIDVNDKAARLLPDITFSATLQNAIHFVGINGLIAL